jgi:glucose/arabinose dehydrogenase
VILAILVVNLGKFAMKNSTSILLITALAFQLSCAQVENTPPIKTPTAVSYTTELVVPDVEIPWGMVFLPNGSLLYTEKEGKLILFQYGKKNEISGLPKTYVRGQGGLMGLALHPNFEQNNRIYFAMATPNNDASGGNTGIYSATLLGNALKNVKLLYKAEPDTKKGQHFGSRIVFDKEGYLYFSVGDRGNRDENPQDITRDNGKIYRLNDDGSIPKDNPFVGIDGAKQAIYSYGHRNPQGLTLHPKTGALWENEHGPRGGDEINIIEAGKNYGWPKITYGKNYSGTTITKNTALPGMEQPFYYWVPSIAASGMAFVTGNKYPDWEGDLLVGSLTKTYLERLTIRNNKVVAREKIADGIGRVRDVIIGPYGYIHIAVEFEGIYRINPN